MKALQGVRYIGSIFNILNSIDVTIHKLSTNVRSKHILCDMHEFCKKENGVALIEHAKEPDTDVVVDIRQEH